MIEIPSAAIRHFQFIVLGIWPVNLLTLRVRGHDWGWDKTPQEVIGLWEWGLFVSFSIAIIMELGVKMFFALAERRRRIEEARAEGKAQGREEGRAQGREEGRAEGRAEARAESLAEARKEMRSETGDMLAVLNAAARTNPDLLPTLLQEYREQILNGSAKD